MAIARYVGLLDPAGQGGRLGVEGGGVRLGRPRQPSGPQPARRGPQHRPVQRVGETDGTVVVGLDQAVGLQHFEGAEVQVVQVRRQGLGEGEAVQGLAFERAGPAEDRGGAFTDGRGQRDGSPPGPLVGVRDGGQQPAHRPQQVAQQPQVAPAQTAQPVGGERVERADAGREQPAGLLLGQRLQRETRQEFAGPQPGDRAGHRGAVRGDDQQAGPSVHGELVDEGGGGVVEQVRIVHQQRADTGQQPDRAVQRDRLRQQMGERREGMARLSGVPAARAQSAPRIASATRRVLPQPAGPVTTMPRRTPVNDRRTRSSSFSRPANGQGSSSVVASLS